MVYYCKYIDKSLQHDWEELVKSNIASGFHQSFEWALFKNGDSWDSYKIGIFDDKTNKIVGGVVMLQFSFSNGTDFLYIPEGPVLDYENEENMKKQWKVLLPAMFEIINVSTKSQTTHFRIEPRISKMPSFIDEKFVKAPVNLQPKFTQVIDLVCDESAILAQMKQKGRYNIKLAEKKGVKVISKPITDKTIAEFFSLYDATFSRKGLDKKDLPFFENLIKSCEPISKLYFAEYEGKNLATELVIYYGDRATYLYGASSDENREMMAPYLMHWEVMKDAKKIGMKEYDLWGIAPPEAEEGHDWEGITDFKKKFGGKTVTLIGAYDYIIQKDLYEAFLKKHES